MTTMQNDIEVDFRIELYWIVSDQVADFDDELRMPVHDRAFMQAQAKSYFDRRATIPPGKDVKLLYEAFDDFLRSLQTHGEDPERLILWHASMQEHLTPVDQSREKQNIAPYLTWRDV